MKKRVKSPMNAVLCTHVKPATGMAVVSLNVFKNIVYLLILASAGLETLDSSISGSSDTKITTCVDDFLAQCALL